jgi:hypothetical protein
VAAIPPINHLRETFIRQSKKLPNEDRRAAPDFEISFDEKPTHVIRASLTWIKDNGIA